MSAKRAEQNWWVDFFDEAFSTALLDREDDKSLPQIVTFLQDKLGLKAGMRVFDQCCGTGAISHALARAGCNMHGVDIIPGYITKASEIAARDALSCQFAVGDAFEYAAPQTCDAAINWYTSFGYVADDAQNIKMLARVYQSLKSGGRFALDYSNSTAQLRKAVQSMREEWTQSTPNGEMRVQRDYYYDMPRGMRGSEWTYTMPDGRVVQKSGESRLYMAKDLHDMLIDVGFKDIQFYGDYHGEALELDSPRCIVVATKA